jgi:hypothetical protein
VTDAVKPLWQNVEQEAPDELVAAECHCAVPRLPIAAVVLVAEAHTALVERNEATVRDGEIGENRLRPGEGRLGVDEPALEQCEVCIEGLTAPQAFNITEERQPARRMGEPRD